MNRFEPFVEFSSGLLAADAKELKSFKKYLHNDTLFLTFRKRFGRIAVTECRGDTKKRTVTKKLAGFHFKKKFKTPLLWMHPNEKRAFKNGCSLTDFLKRLDPAGQERMLEIYIGKVFEKFATDDSDLLNGFAIDMTTDNCLIGENGKITFIDFEYEYRKRLHKSHVVFRIIEHCGLPVNKKELYVHFCQKLKLPELYEYYADLECGLFCGVLASPKKSKLLKLISCFIPDKKKRRKFRANNQSLECRRFRKIFGKDNI